MTEISIIIPVYNAELFLKESLESVINQNFKNMEIICVDDGSTDKSLSILKKYSNKYDFIKVFSKQNEGSGKARNFAMDKASGKYIAFLDSDDIFLCKNALCDMYEVAFKNNADMVSANLKGITLNGEIVENNILNTYDKKEVITANDYGIPWEFYKNIYKKSFLDENNIIFPDLLRGQDPVFLSKVLSNIDKIYTVAVDLYGYRYPKRRSLYKINNYQKRFDYIIQFKYCFDILNKAGLNNLAEKYLDRLYEFLDFSYNRYNADIEKIIHEVFKTHKSILSECQNHIVKPKISVIARVNSIESIKSLLNQSFKEFEVLCISDLNLDEIISHDARVKITNNDVNDLIYHTRGDYIYLFDNYLLKKNYLKKLYANNSKKLMDRSEAINSNLSFKKDISFIQKIKKKLFKFNKT